MRITSTVATAAAVLVLLIAFAPTASAADFTISGVDISPEQPITGEPTTFTVNIKNTGSETVHFEEETRMKMYVDGKATSTVNFLVKPNWTKPPIYLSVEPGETETWDMTINQKVVGDRDIRIVIEGPYKYGGETKGLKVTWEDTVEFVNPEVKSFDIWITTYNWGIKPTVTVANGRAYTGEAYIKILKNGTEVFQDTYELRGESTFVKEARYDKFFGENGTYVVETGFEGKTATKEIQLNRNPSGATASTAQPGENPADQEEDEGQSSRSVPAPGIIGVALSLLVAARLVRR